MKKVLSFILVLSMVLGSMGMAFANPAETTQDAIDAMVELGFVQGDEGGLRLDETIRRSEVAVIATRIAGLEDIALKSNYQGVFTDVTPDMWDNPVMNGAINVAAGQGYVKGYPDGTFLPNEDVTNAEIITLMVRLAVSAEEVVELDKGAWPAAYITKAAELGILEGTNVDNFGEAATRETVFLLGYNAHAVRAEEGHYIVKALVLENDRVERIGKGEVVVEVIEEVQRADFADESRKEKGDQLRLDVAELADVEDLLGKVINISFDKNDNVVRYTEDTTYQYLDGAIKAEENKLTLGGKAYTVVLDERYESKDERVFRTYLNNDALSYKNFYQDATRDKDERAKDEFKADYARVTIKNGKVIFIDAYKFDDIAPVKEINKDDEVLVYNDSRDGAIKKLDIKNTSTFSAVKEGKITTATREDIKANDVIHEYNGGFIIRKDAVVNGKFEKVSEARNGDILVHVDGEEYKVRPDKDVYMRPVYSYDSGDFYTLLASNAENALKEFRGEKVTVLLDLAGDLQYIGSEIELGEFVGLVTRVVGRDMRVLKTDGKTYDYHATLNTKVADGTGHQTLGSVGVGDLVYMSVDGEAIDKIEILSENELHVEDLTNRTIKLAGEDEYRVLGDTNIFVEHDETVRTLKEVVDAYDKDNGDKSGVRAYVIDGKEFADHTRRAEANITRKTEAHTIVFTDLVIKAKEETVIAEFNGYADKQDRQMKIILEDGTRETRNVTRNADIVKGLVGGDIIEIQETKDDKKDITKATLLITNKNDKNTFKVVNYDDNKSRNLILEDRHGATNKDNEYYVDGKTVIFGGRLASAEKVSLVLDGETRYVKAILVRGKTADITASFDEIGSVDGALSFEGYLGAGKVRLGGRTYDVKDDVRAFIENNEPALDKGAALSVNIVDGEITRIVGLVVNGEAVTIDGEIEAGRNLDIKGNIIVNGDRVVINNINAEEIHQFKETLTLNNVKGEKIEVNAKGTQTLTLKGNTEIATVNVNKKHTIKVEGNAKVTSEIVVSAEAKETEIIVATISNVAKVTTYTTDITVPNGITVVGKGTAEQAEITKTVASAVYNDEGRYDVTFTIETKNADKVKITYSSGFRYEGSPVIDVVDNKVEFKITVDEPKNLLAKFVAIFKEEDSNVEIQTVEETVELKADKFPEIE